MTDRHHEDLTSPGGARGVHLPLPGQGAGARRRGAGAGRAGPAPGAAAARRWPRAPQPPHGGRADGRRAGPAGRRQRPPLREGRRQEVQGGPLRQEGQEGRQGPQGEEVLGRGREGQARQEAQGVALRQERRAQEEVPRRGQEVRQEARVRVRPQGREVPPQEGPQEGPQGQG